MRVTQLVNHSIAVGRTREQAAPDNPEIVDVWQLILIDQQTGDQTVIAFRDGVRDTLVQQLTGGIVIANGSLPGL